MKRSIVTLPIVLGVIGALGFAAAPPSFAATKKSEHGMAATKHAKKSTARVKTKKTAVAAAKPAAPAAPAQTAVGSEMMKPPPKVKPIFPDTPPPPAR